MVLDTNERCNRVMRRNGQPVHICLPSEITFNEQLGWVSLTKKRERLPYRCNWSIPPVFSGVRVIHLRLFL